MLEDCDDYARREHAKKGIAIEEIGTRPKQSTSITQRKRGGNVSRCSARYEIVVKVACMC